MSVIAAAVKHMLAAGMPAEAVVAAVADMEAGMASAPAPLTPRQARNKRYYEERKARLNSAQNELNSVGKGAIKSGASELSTPPASPSLKEKSPRTPLKENNPSPSPSQSSLAFANSESSTDAVDPGEFDRWYAHFPNKVGKAAALKAWTKARSKASYLDLCNGLRRYLAKTDDRPWCNPATWLNQERWLDEPAAVSKPLKGTALLRENLRQEILNEGLGGEESANTEPVRRLAYHGRLV